MTSMRGWQAPPPSVATIECKTARPLILRGCPRCHGDLFVDRQAAGWFTCFACGREYFNANYQGERDE